MGRKIIILLILLSASCNNAEFSNILPANPPVDLEIILLDSANLDPAYSSFAGDYLLLFRSENTKNARFGGFFIFIASTEDDVLLLQTRDDASYILGIKGEEENSTMYNKGIDTQIAVLFSDTDTGEIIVNEIVNDITYTVTYTVTSRRSKTAAFIPDNWLAMRTYLYNSTAGEVIEDEISSPGNPVQIP